ncbi:hypothetical protein [Azorhizobium sp. AG788]|uniref:hypothetical protein n=1 Tax=Azorhizobium sp. AG788 TaxID=2183897 RepID=UPI00313932EC
MGEVIPFRRPTAALPPLTAEAIAAPALMVGATGFALYAAGVVLIAHAALLLLTFWRR